jgi:predicted nucleic acid-binding protein
MEESLLIADASTLLNFLRVRRFDLMQGLGYRIRIVDAVFEEIQSEREHLEELVNGGHIKTLTLEGKAITDTVATLLGLGLGSGESFSFAAAIEFEGAVAIDDLRAVKRVQSVSPNLKILTTPDIVVAGIHSRTISVADADKLKVDWAENHRFRMKFATFTDLLQATGMEVEDGK